MRRSIVYRDGAITKLADSAAIAAALEQKDSLVWVDMQSPDESDYAVIRDDFQFHPLAVEDVERQGQRAKVDQYRDYNLIVLLDLELNHGAAEMQMRQLMLFVGVNFVVSVHTASITAVDEFWQRLEREPSIIAPHPLSLLVYQIADALVDNYFPIVDHFDDRLSDLEDQLFDGLGRVTLSRLFAMRKSLIGMRRLTNQMRDVFNILVRREQLVFHENTLPYYTDIYDHLLRISETLELQRDLLSGALESYLSIQSNELNLTVRKLTAVTVMVMVPTLIAGIYGMNFDIMPELRWALGYPMAIVLMMLSGAGLFFYFHRIDWL
ncbi:MAG: magnesium/cobalt transporter CorA [Chloroflexota bacterium]